MAIEIGRLRRDEQTRHGGERRQLFLVEQEPADARHGQQQEPGRQPARDAAPLVEAGGGGGGILERESRRHARGRRIERVPGFGRKRIGGSERRQPLGFEARVALIVRGHRASIGSRMESVQCR